MTHLENLIIEYYTWLGCVVRHNQKVGRRARGGWEMELDVVVYDTSQKRVIHLEPSSTPTIGRRENRGSRKSLRPGGNTYQWRSFRGFRAIPRSSRLRF